MDPAPTGEARREGRVGLDSLLRWVREELDATRRVRGGTAPAPSAAAPREAPRAASGVPRVALLAVSAPEGGFGGAERLYSGLEAALAQRGVAVERIDLASDESSFDRILETYLAAYDVDLSAFDGVISTKAPSYAVRHRNHVSYLMHTLRSFYDMFDEAFPDASPMLRAQRDVLVQIDGAALARPSLRGRFAVGSEVRDRLRAFNGLDAEVLHHPSTPLPSRGRGDGARHVLVPGRLHRWKRVDLAIEAARRMRNAVDWVVTGAGDDEARLRALAAGTPHVRFVGHVDDATLGELYADAGAVVFCPEREDYGLVTVEAFAAGKPVVTCRDSGEPARLVADGLDGFVCAPDPAALAERLDWLLENPGPALEMGRRGRAKAERIGWDRVCERLLGALRLTPEPA